MQLNIKKIDSKYFTPILIIIFLIIGYFVYNNYYNKDSSLINNSSNAYLSDTELGKNVDILSKEDIRFNTNIDNTILNNVKDFSISIIPSQGGGRSNPFLP